jgi:UDP-glucose 4-epimerase
VLVTGGAGFIGKYVAAELKQRGHAVVMFDGHHNITDFKALASAAEPCDGIINLAGQLGTEEMIGAEARAVRVNIEGAVNVYDVAARRGIPVVQIGTGHKGQPNPYAITKAAAEDLGLARARWRGDKIAVVRAFHAYGPGQKVPPPHGNAKVRKIVPSFVCRALTGMPLEVWGDGLQLIDLVHVEDVAAVLVDALSGPFGEVTEAGTGVPTSVVAAAWKIIEATDSDSYLEHFPMRPGEPEWTRVVAAVPKCGRPWPHGLKHTIDWYRRELRVAAA